MNSTSPRAKAKVAGLFPNRTGANKASARLERAGFERGRIHYLNPDSDERSIEKALVVAPDDVPAHLARDAGTGAAAGGALGVAAAVGLPTLFISVPVIGPLAAMTYGATIGGTVGALKGLKLREGHFASIVRDGLNNGCHAVIVHTNDDDDLEHAYSLMRKTLGERQAAQ